MAQQENHKLRLDRDSFGVAMNTRVVSRNGHSSEDLFSIAALIDTIAKETEACTINSKGQAVGVGFSFLHVY